MTDMVHQLIRTLTPEKRALLAEMLRPPPEPIAIVGVGCRFPGSANSPEAFWQILRDGIDTAGDVPAERWDMDAYYDPDPDAPGKMYTRHFALLRDIGKFDSQFFDISPREAMRMDNQQQLLLEVAWEALERAGQPAATLAGTQTGVFIGIANNHFDQLQLERNNAAWVNDPYFMIGNSASIAAGRLAYQLDIQGPCMALDTACSSSLVAVHLACQSLRSGECSMAIVGGVHTLTVPEGMVNLCKMRMLAADGRCKTFDATADGYVVGEGCGVLILKRLSDARAQHDQILAVVRGSAINEDGGSSTLTAPNGLAQQAVIRKALASAQIDPTQVSFVEAHGSGTPLGDPIEIEAIDAVLCKNRPADLPLMIGTVKTNLGHLAAAAGMAGLIKTVLALQHRQIPPHLHLRVRNPNIRWNDQRFTVPTTLTAWHSPTPRIAGVSSFGWSGTNAHILLEEAPAATAIPAASTRPWQILGLTAKTDAAVERATDRLVAYLHDHPTVELSTIAANAFTRRTPFNRRRAVIARDASAAGASLERRDPALIDGVTTTNPSAVAFMFPGLGDQYQGMARQFYEHEPVFREHVERCADILQPLLGQDVREALFSNVPTAPVAVTEGGKIDLRRMLRHDRSSDEDTQPLIRTQLAQPVLFVIEYALARLWMSWGVRPQAMIGYSLGEYVAACIADVMSLEDALRLVARRAQLIADLPAGAMVAIALPAEHAEQLFDGALSLTAINGPQMCVVGGPVEAVKSFEARLVEREVVFHRLATGHAFHSPMMELAAPPLAALARTMRFSPPQIPYLSNVTGTWITADEATDPNYWVRHLLQPVRFSDGLSQLWQRAGMLIEVGPGQTLGSLALQHPASAHQAERVVVPSLRHVYDSHDDYDMLLHSLGRLWVAGASVDWQAFYGAHGPLADMPTYPFEPNNYWLPPQSAEATKPLQPAAPTIVGKQADITDWFAAPIWKQAPLTAAVVATHGPWLIFADATGVGADLADRLRSAGSEVTLVRAGTGFRRLQDELYTINLAAPIEYVELLAHLQRINRLPERIVHCWSVGQPKQGELNATAFAQDYGFYSLLFLAQALGNHHAFAPRIDIISSNMHEIVGGDGHAPEKATLLGPCKVIPNEYAGVTCRSIDIVLPQSAPNGSVRLIEQLYAELHASGEDDVIAYRGASRWVRALEPTRLSSAGPQPTHLREHGTYMITGGLGGLGLSLAHDLARRVQAKLVLVSRSSLPPREEWANWLVVHPLDEPTSRKIRGIQLLEAAGTEVFIAIADVGNVDEMAEVVADARARFGPIHGVIHTAGVPGEGLIQLKTPAMAAVVLWPKLQGTLALEAALRHETLDFMVLYSSSNSVLGGLGEVDYCAANAFLDAFAQARSARGQPTFAINWGPWQWDAWQSSLFGSMPQIAAELKQLRDTSGISLDEGAEALQRILAAALPQVLVLPQGLHATLAQWQELFSVSFWERKNEPLLGGATYPRPNLRNPYVAPRSPDEQKVAAIWQELLGIEQIGIHDQFFELGGNSLIGIMLISRLQKEFGVQLSVASLFEGPTVSALLALIQPAEQSIPMLDLDSERGKRRRELRKRSQRSLRPSEIGDSDL